MSKTYNDRWISIEDIQILKKFAQHQAEKDFGTGIRITHMVVLPPSQSEVQYIGDSVKTDRSLSSWSIKPSKPKDCKIKAFVSNKIKVMFGKPNLSK